MTAIPISFIKKQVLILIIVLLFVKPSDETLEDVGEEKTAKSKKASKKEKKAE